MPYPIASNLKAKGDYSAIVYKEGDLVIAEDPNGRIIAQGEAGVDDAEVIQSALDSLTPNRTWKETVLLKGSFVLSKSIKLSDYTKLVIDGKLRFADDVTDDSLITNVDWENGNKFIDIMGGVLDATVSGNSDGIRFERCTYCRIVGVEVYGASGNGGVFGHGILIDTYSKYNVVKSCYTHNNNANGIVLRAYCECNVIIGCVFKNNNYDNIGTWRSSRNRIIAPICIGGNTNGIRLEANSNNNEIVSPVIIQPATQGIKIDWGAVNEPLHGNKIIGGYIDASGANHGVVIEGGYDNKVIGLFVENAKQAGIYIRDAHSNLIKGCTCKNNNQASDPNNNAGIVIHYYGNYTCEANKIIANKCYDDQDTKTQEYGIKERGATDYNVIVYNDVRENKTAGLYIVGANTIVKNNIGYLTENSGTATFSGDGSTTQFSIEHGLVSTPSKVQVTPMSEDASGDFYVTADATYIYVNYKTAPPSGTDNIKVSWHAEV